MNETAPISVQGLRLVPIPILAAGGRWRVEAMRALSEPLLLWFTKGQGRITVAGETRGYTSHNCVFIPPGVMHGFDVAPQVFGLALFFGPSRGLHLPDTPQHLRLRDTFVQQELNGLLDAIQREMESDAPGARRALAHHLGLLGVWLERQSLKAAAEAPRPDAAKRLVARYTALLERDFSSGMGIADFAEALGVTSTHLTRCCKQASGRSALALLQDRRLFEARRLLAETKMPVAEIASRLGFTSPAYFTRAFHHLTGASPRSFRRAV